MRSDHLKRHMKKHVDLSSEDPEQICKSILEDVINDIPNKKSSKEETSVYKRNDPHSNGLDESQGDEIDEYTPLFLYSGWNLFIQTLYNI